MTKLIILNPSQGKYFGRVLEGSASGGQDWSTLVGKLESFESFPSHFPYLKRHGT